MDRTYVRAWVDGWVVSRGAAPPVEQDWGYYFDIGPFAKSSRFVLAESDEARVRTLTRDITASGVWVTVFEEPERVREWLGAPGWTLDTPCHLMTATLTRTDAGRLPEGYELRTWERGGVVRVVVLAPDGGAAARGQIGLPDGRRTAVVDQIETAPAHRRKGLGRLVMSTLGNAALDAGFQDAVLGATGEGRALYSALGWRVLAPLTDLFRVTGEDGAVSAAPSALATAVPASVAERAVGAARMA